MDPLIVQTLSEIVDVNCRHMVSCMLSQIRVNGNRAFGVLVLVFGNFKFLSMIIIAPLSLGYTY